MKSNKIVNSSWKNININAMKFISRRDFVKIGALLTGIFALPSCCRDDKKARTAVKIKGIMGSETQGDDELAVNRKMPRDLVYKLLDQKADQYMQMSFNCAQSSFRALEEQFGLNADQVLKALTPLTGIAERGETCGAVIGPLMVMGLLYGRGRGQMQDWNKYRSSLEPAGKFCDLFVEKYGSTMCADIQEVKYGRCYKLKDPDELKDFQAAGATEKCSMVVKSGLHMAADIILDRA